MFICGKPFTTLLIIQGEVKILSYESYIFRLNMPLVSCWTELSCRISEQLRGGTMQRVALVALSLIVLFAICTAYPTQGKFLLTLGVENDTEVDSLSGKKRDLK